MRWAKVDPIAYAPEVPQTTLSYPRYFRYCRIGLLTPVWIQEKEGQGKGKGMKRVGV